MIAEMIMAHYGWEVWSSPIAEDDPVRERYSLRPWHVFRDGFYVGTWTGPDGDLLCVRRCTTRELAELSLAKPAPTILLAALRSLAQRAAEDVLVPIGAGLMAASWIAGLVRKEMRRG